MPRFRNSYCCELLAILVLGIAASLINWDYCEAQNVDPGEPLLLTPMIKSGEHRSAQEAAFVPEFAPMLSYSGFITVNEEYNSNIFFWFFPAEASYEDPDDYYNNDIPVILWNDGGPGVSCMLSVFGESGPFLGNADGINYTINPLSWHKKYHMIYMDNPVEVGFSHTEAENGFIHSGAEAAKNIYEFLTQFFKMFPHLQRNPFYNAGVSYGGTYASEVAYYIHHQNLNNPSIFINLTGVIMDSPWIEAYTQVHYGEVLFGAGVISKDNRDEYLRKESELRGLIEEEKWTEGFTLWWDILKVRAPELTGYEAMYHLGDDVSRATILNMTNFVTMNSTRKALHVGNVSFELMSEAQLARMTEHMMQSSAAKLDDVLKNGYRLLMYVGNMDVITGHIGIRKLFESLTWEGRDEYINGERTLWKVDDRPVGYITTWANTTFVMMRNAGHACYMDHPDLVFKMISNFLG